MILVSLLLIVHTTINALTIPSPSTTSQKVPPSKCMPLGKKLGACSIEDEGKQGDCCEGLVCKTITTMRYDDTLFFLRPGKTQKCVLPEEKVPPSKCMPLGTEKPGACSVENEGKQGDCCEGLVCKTITSIKYTVFMLKPGKTQKCVLPEEKVQPSKCKSLGTWGMGACSIEDEGKQGDCCKGLVCETSIQNGKSFVSHMCVKSPKVPPSKCIPLGTPKPEACGFEKEGKQGDCCEGLVCKTISDYQYDFNFIFPPPRDTQNCVRPKDYCLGLDLLINRECGANEGKEGGFCCKGLKCQTVPPEIDDNGNPLGEVDHRSQCVQPLQEPSKCKPLGTIRSGTCNDEDEGKQGDCCEGLVCETSIQNGKSDVSHQCVLPEEKVPPSKCMPLGTEKPGACGIEKEGKQGDCCEGLVCNTIREYKYGEFFFWARPWDIKYCVLPKDYCLDVGQFIDRQCGANEGKEGGFCCEGLKCQTVRPDTDDNGNPLGQVARRSQCVKSLQVLPSKSKPEKVMPSGGQLQVGVQVHASNP